MSHDSSIEEIRESEGAESTVVLKKQKPQI